MKEQEKIFEDLVQKILPWYKKHARSMPWRMEKPDPYWTLVSEIMLQQTRVETVLSYFPRFIEALPTLKDLAEAPEELLMKLWEGLGYYSRARNLQKAARAAMERFQGELPRSADLLRTLPGIGEYTSGAIASIAFHQKEPAVDGNVMRVCSRLLNSDRDIMDPGFRRSITESLRSVYPDGSCSEFTQSLMDLGATVCIPGNPRCDSCPLQEICLAHKHGRESLLPVKQKKLQRKIETKTVLILQDESRKTALRKRPGKGVLAGMWELPWLEGSADGSRIRSFLETEGPEVITMEFVRKGRHIFTHLEWHMDFWKIICRDAEGPFTWADPEELLNLYSLPAAFRKFL